MKARKSPPHIALGQSGEEEAARHLSGRGWRIVRRNWRPQGALAGLELDIVAYEGDELVFVEVKSRTHSLTGPAAREALGAQKRRRLLKAAGLYLTQFALWHKACRFDLICLDNWPDGRQSLEHYRNVIEIGHSLDSGHTAWQPW